MNSKNSRTIMLIGEENLEKLKNSRIAVFGIGGVGGFALEALARSGVGTIDIIDSDTVDISNINRQIIATSDNIGEDKVDAALERIKSINPDITVNKHKVFFSKETANLFDFRQYDYIIDAIDTITAKLELISKADISNIPIISSMGTGNKLNPQMLEVSDIFKTSVCPLARVMRYELKKRGIKRLKVVYSKEEPIKPTTQNLQNSKSIPASMVFVPACAGMILAAEAIKDIINK